MPYTIDLPENCDTPWALHFHETMTHDVPPAGPVRLRADGVGRINTPAVQVIVALARSLEARQENLEVDAPSHAFSSAFADLGLTETLQGWSSAAHG